MSKIAIYFPGLGYTTEKPLLHFGNGIAHEMGYQEERKLSYSLQIKENLRNNPEGMKKAYEELFLQAEKQLKDIEWNKHDDILFVSKSIGTIVAAAYAEKYQIKQVKHVLYTPLVFTYQFHPENTIAFIGTKDSWSDVKEIIRLSKETSVPLEVYDNCNHSLETDNILENLEILKNVMLKTKKFIEEN